MKTNTTLSFFFFFFVKYINWFYSHLQFLVIVFKEGKKKIRIKSQRMVSLKKKKKIKANTDITLYMFLISKKIWIM